MTTVTTETAAWMETQGLPCPGALGWPEYHFGGKPISDESCKHIADIVGNRSIEGFGGLFLNDGNVSDAGFQLVAEALAKRENPNLKYICLYNNQIGDGGAAALAKALPMLPNLQNLLISQNKVTDVGMAALIKAFGECKLANFKEFAAADNEGVSDASLTALAEACAAGALPELKVSLRLDGTKVGEAGVQSLAKALDAGALPKLKAIHLGKASVSDALKETLASAVAKSGASVDLLAPISVA